jgi:hypothetical protein
MNFTRITSYARYLFALFAAGVVLFLFFGSMGYRGTDAQKYVDACASAADRAACYEQLIPELYPERSVSQVFDVIREVRTIDKSYQFCHVAAHKLGQRVVAEDPQRWSEAIALNPADGLCSNGFVHGVTGGRFRSEVLSPETIEAYIGDFTDACAPRNSWNPSDLDRAICYHGMGHLYDFITNADIKEALTLCSRTAPEEYQRVCIEGVFMQIFQPLEPDDYALIEQMKVRPDKDTVRAYCAAYKQPAYVGACLRESWPYVKEDIKDGTGVEAFCSGHPDAQRTEECYQTVSSLVGRLSLGSLEDIATACNTFPEERRGMCFSYSAEVVLQENRMEAPEAVALCEKAEGAPRSMCLDQLLSRTNFIFGNNTAQIQRFCKALPEPWSGTCRTRR